MRLTHSKELEGLARNLVGDNEKPNLYFVSDKGGVLLVTTDFIMAHGTWKQLPRDQESALEDRLVGVLASTEPESDSPKARLVTYDDSDELRKRGNRL